MKNGMESFTWLPSEALEVLKTEGGVVVRGHAIHPVKTLHPETWQKVKVYTAKELERAARTLVGKPINVNHNLGPDRKPLPQPRNVGVIAAAEWEDDAVEYAGLVTDPEYASRIGKDITKVSIEYQYLDDAKVDGYAPKGVILTGLAVLTPDFEPGDPQAYIEPWEGIIKEWTAWHEAADRPFLKALEAWLKKAPGEGEAEYPWDQCIADMKSQGHDDDSAARICAAIKRRTVQHILESGLAKDARGAVEEVSRLYKESPIASYLMRTVYEQCNQLREQAEKLQELQQKPTARADTEAAGKEQGSSKPSSVAHPIEQVYEEKIAKLTGELAASVPKSKLKDLLPGMVPFGAPATYRQLVDDLRRLVA